MSLALTVLGSGDAAGIPRPHCPCPACARAQAGGRRRRNTCALIEADGLRVAIDTGCGGQVCDALLLTHYHADHAGLIDEFPRMPAWGPDDGLPPRPTGRPGVDHFPRPVQVQVAEPFTTLRIGALRCTPVPLRHPIPVFGWVIEHGGVRVAWLTDSYGLPPTTLTWLRDHPCDLLALDTTFPPDTARAPERLHGTVPVSVDAIRASGARRGLLIHIGHELQSWLDAEPRSLPDGISVAEDGQRFVLPHHA